MFQNRFRYLYLLALSTYSFLNILFLNNDRLYIFEVNLWYLFFDILLIVGLIWEGNRLIADKVLPKMEGKLKPIHPLLLHFGLSVLLSFLVSYSSLVFTLQVFDRPGIDFWANLKLNAGFSFRVNLFLNCVNAIVYYMNELQRSKVEAETLKKINMEAQFASLKAQVNPHFLFNSLNILSGLVHKDQEVATVFINQLSLVYRYVLNQQWKKLVSLEEEMVFLKAYLQLLELRFQDSIEVDNNINGISKDYQIPPATTQVLVENVIKHNVVSRNRPMIISLGIGEDHYLVVNNTLQERRQKDESTNIGLKNIIDRYKFLTDKEVIVSKSSSSFQVKVPLLHITNQ